jgi:hypothetical protein
LAWHHAADGDGGGNVAAIAALPNDVGAALFQQRREVQIIAGYDITRQRPRAVGAQEMINRSRLMQTHTKVTEVPALAIAGLFAGTHRLFLDR